MHQLKPKEALNKAFLKVKPIRNDIELFKTNLKTLIEQSNIDESEEHHKNNLSDFLKKTYFDGRYFINTKGRQDLVIHNGDHNKTPVGVIIEAKKPSNKSEMLSLSNINTKAFQELLLYFLRERITNKNLEVKNLIATNVQEWFIFDAQIFEKQFANDKKLIQQFKDFEDGKLSGTTTEFFYSDIAKPFIQSCIDILEFTYFKLEDYSKALYNDDIKDDVKLISLYKLLSPEHLLKLPFANDSNSLDKKFYNELLHIIGLEEVKDGGKKVISRKAEADRNYGSLLENTIYILEEGGYLSNIKNESRFGDKNERAFNVALELCITWINRILFLKLLESQLYAYNKGDEKFKFMNFKTIPNYDDLNKLFFSILAKKENERHPLIKEKYSHIPYLNSSLFEKTELEQSLIVITNLDNNIELEIYGDSVLKDENGKKLKGKKDTLEYLFEFLDSYDFTSEGSEEIQEENKSLINASVLGLIFEKINGYKDGSFFTPGFITMYMCKETIRRAVVQKFNEYLKKSLLEKGNNKEISPLERGQRGVSELKNKEHTSKSPLERRLQEKNKERRRIIPYNSELKQLARDLRNNSTKSEIHLWSYLKGKYKGKYDFQRQKPLLNYIADFYCYELNLVIEIDGNSHNDSDRLNKDKLKEFEFNQEEVNILRFSDVDVLNNTESVLYILDKYIDSYEIFDWSYFDENKNHLNIYSKNSPTNVLKSPLERGQRGVSELKNKEHTSKSPLERRLEETKFREISTFDELYDIIGENELINRTQANQIINSLKICDPAVGSGHFLVSALNEIIAIKHDLKILQDKNGKRLKEYQVSVINDELIVTDEDGELFEYNPRNPESQRIQETLFNEKQTIIENCLFGVDINPNSVKICRLRLWIELLKNAYYKTPSPTGRAGVGFSADDIGSLETLPNIDINIKSGNSLISRFPIDINIKDALKNNKSWNIESYKFAVSNYRNAKSKDEKRQLEELIKQIKTDFRSDVNQNDPQRTKLKRLMGVLEQLQTQTTMFERSKAEQKQWEKDVKNTSNEISKIEKDIDDIESNQIYHNAFEWRFEFPEVLDDDGTFIGFDAVIGNPPYIQLQNNGGKLAKELDRFNYHTFARTGDIYSIFIEKGIQILAENKFLSFITSNKWMRAGYGEATRDYLFQFTNPKILIDLIGTKIFDEATVDTNILITQKSDNNNQCMVTGLDNHFNISDDFDNYINNNLFITKSFNTKDTWAISSPIEEQIKLKIESIGTPLKEWDIKINYGIKTGFNEAFIIDGKTKDKLIEQDPKSAEIIKPILRGRDIKKYSSKFADLWLINTHNGVKDLDIPRINVEEYPAIKGHLDLYYDKLNKRGDKGDTLYNLRNCAYLQEFEKEKIVYNDISRRLTFSYLNENTYFNNTVYFIQGNQHLKYLLGILNSNVIDWFYKVISVQLGSGAMRLFSIYMYELPIPKLTQEQQQPIIDLVDKILEAKKENPEADISHWEAEIDQLVYKLYDLTEEEIKIVEEG